MIVSALLGVSFNDVTKALKKGHIQPDELRKRAFKVKRLSLKEAGNVDQK